MAPRKKTDDHEIPNLSDLEAENIIVRKKERFARNRSQNLRMNLRNGSRNVKNDTQAAPGTSRTELEKLDKTYGSCNRCAIKIVSDQGLSTSVGCTGRIVKRQDFSLIALSGDSRGPLSPDPGKECLEIIR